MPKKLYTATIEIEMLVCAETLDDARQVAAKYIAEDLNNQPPGQWDFDVMPVGFHKDQPVLPGTWTVRDVPYGADSDEQTVAAIIAATSKTT